MDVRAFGAAAAGVGRADRQSRTRGRLPKERMVLGGSERVCARGRSLGTATRGRGSSLRRALPTAGALRMHTGAQTPHLSPFQSVHPEAHGHFPAAGGLMESESTGDLRLRRKGAETDDCVDRGNRREGWEPTCNAANVW